MPGSAKLGKLDNHDQEPWKLPLRDYIEHLYRKRFDRDRPEVVLSLEDRARRDEAKKARRREAKMRRRQANEETRGLDERDSGTLRRTTGSSPHE
jgi:hypothetical protein